MKDTKRKCLIVEDDELWHKILRGVPEEANCLVTFASSLEAARREVERQFFHVALVDLSLVLGDDTNKSGLLVVDWFHDLREGTQSILVTIHGTLEVGFDVAHRGAVGAISKKGFETQAFAGIFHSALETAIREQKASMERFRHPEVELLRGERMQQLWEYDILSAFAPFSGSIELVYTLLRSLLEPLAPLMPPRERNPSTINPDRHIVSSSLWSRALGKPIKLAVGRKSEIDALRAALPPNTPIAAEESRLDLSGFAAEAPELDFGDFRSPFDLIAKPSELAEKTGHSGR
jgi:ActR/RegA family two-component response regulator